MYNSGCVSVYVRNKTQQEVLLLENSIAVIADYFLLTAHERNRFHSSLTIAITFF